MEFKGKAATYLAAMSVIVIWGVTFVSTKYLLVWLTPTEILLCRYVIAYAVFFAMNPRPLPLLPRKDELTAAFCGLLGMTLYFIFENTSLLFTTASNCSLIAASAPMMTGILANLMTPDEKFTRRFLVGCVLGFCGIFLIVCNGHFVLRLNPLGDMLVVLAALSFSLYSVKLRSIGGKYPAEVVTRKMIFYSLLSLAPFALTPQVSWKPRALMEFSVWSNLLFLGALASAYCFFTWNKVIMSLGAVKANVMIYLSPAVTMVCAAIILKEKITPLAVAGGLLILAGVYIAQKGKN